MVDHQPRVACVRVGEPVDRGRREHVAERVNHHIGQHREHLDADRRLDDVGTINTSLNNVNQGLARLGTASKRLDLQMEFVTKLSDSLKSGRATLVDADMAVKAPRLQSLQVKQQLGVQALSIANGAPQSILSLFQ